MAGFLSNFTKKDKVISLIAISLSLVSIVSLLSLDFFEKDSTTHGIALFLEKNNDIRYKSEHGVSFRNASDDIALQSGDKVFIGEKSSAKIQFLKSKTEILATGPTLLSVAENTNGDETAVVDGLAQFIIQKNKTLTIELQGKKFELQTENESAAINSYIENGQVMLKATSGNATLVTDNKKKIKLETNAAIVLKVSASLGAISSLPLKLISPKNDETLPLLSGILLTWEGPTQATVSISKSQHFDLIQDTSSLENSPKTWFPKVGPGIYFLKIKTGTQEQIVKISLEYKIPAGQIFPSEGERVVLDPKQSFTFRWQEIGESIIFIKNESAQEIRQVVTNNEFTTDLLRGKNIVWSLFKKSKEGQDLLIVGPNHFLLAFNGSYIIKSIVKNESLLFTWNGFPDERFTVVITKEDDPHFILNKEVTSPELSFKSKKSGKFKLSLTSIDYPRATKTEYPFSTTTTIGTWDDDNFKNFEIATPPSKLILRFKTQLGPLQKFPLEISFEGIHGKKEVKTKVAQGMKHAFELNKAGNYCFRLLPPPEINSYTPSSKHCVQAKHAQSSAAVIENGNLKTIEDKSLEAYKLRIPAIENAAKYEFEIFSDINGEVKVFTKSSPKATLTWVSKRGEFFYARYRVFDEKNIPSKFSEIFQVRPLRKIISSP